MCSFTTTGRVRKGSHAQGHRVPILLASRGGDAVSVFYLGEASVSVDEGTAVQGLVL